MKSLTTQAGNETLGSTERGYIADQIEALADDINDIALSTKFQGVQLLDGGDSDEHGTNTQTGTKDLTFQWVRVLQTL